MSRPKYPEILKDYRRILTVQDISCVGQCSLTVALPILSACGLETCILPSAVLSTHTAGFTGYTFRDLSEDIPKIEEHWCREGIKFDAVYTGYLGSTGQIDMVKSIIHSCMKEGGVAIIDPAMADNGKLYPAFDLAYVEAMRSLVAEADILLPNLTEACFLVDEPTPETYSEEDIDRILEKLAALGAKKTVLTGISYRKGKTGVVIYDDGKTDYYEHKKIANGCHGTGDVYAAAFTGCFMRGMSLYNSAMVAADYVVKCIEYTQRDPSHFYGVKFEPLLPALMSELEP